MDEKIFIASIYVPPGSMPPLEIFDKYKDKEIFIFGDFNAKHQDWNCECNNVSGNKLKEWLIDNGFETLHPYQPTSKRSNSVIDFGIGRKKKLQRMKDGQNIWSYVRQVFKPYSPAFRGLKTPNGVVKNNQEIADQLANFYEKHFAEPTSDSKNYFHLKCLEAYENIKHSSNLPLDQIKIEEVILQWKKFAPKKSLDSVENSAFLLKQVPSQYLGTITVLFNRCAADGKCFEGAKISKGIFLSKDGVFPTMDRLRSISLLPNLGKVFERILVARIEKWCNDQGIHLDEQSGFTANKRLQSRILGIVEDLRLTIAAPNRAALALFIDFSTAFDRVWWPALFHTLEKLEMSIELRKWIFNWLQNSSSIGVLTFTQDNANSPVKITGRLTGLSNNTLLGFHIHEFPLIGNIKNCTAAGGHFNPYSKLNSRFTITV
ncbi:unnamed protein product [Rotaria sp. Silwood1]|nr:unnamed protein product [Rotaria sp. Silwood1]